MKPLLFICFVLMLIGCASVPKCPKCPSEELYLIVDCKGSPLILPFEPGELMPDHKSHGEYWFYKHEIPKDEQKLLPSTNPETREEWKDRIEAQGRPTAGL